MAIRNLFVRGLRRSQTAPRAVRGVKGSVPGTPGRWSRAAPAAPGLEKENRKRGGRAHPAAADSLASRPSGPEAEGSRAVDQTLLRGPGARGVRASPASPAPTELRCLGARLAAPPSKSRLVGFPRQSWPAALGAPSRTPRWRDRARPRPAAPLTEPRPP